MPWTDNLTDEAREALPEELTSNEMLGRFNSIDELAKGFVETKSAMGQSIRIPHEDAGDEARAQFIEKLVKQPEVMLRPDFTDPDQSKEYYKVLGVPDDATAYENPEGADLPAEVEAELRPLLHEANLTPAQYALVVKGLAEKNAQTVENITSARTEDQQKLAGKWGQAYESRIAAAKKVHEEFGYGEWDSLTSEAIENLYKTSEALTGQPAQVANQPTEGKPILTPDEALRQAQEIMSNPAYFDNSDPYRQKQLMQKHEELLRMAGFSDDINQLRAS